MSFRITLLILTVGSANVYADASTCWSKFNAMKQGFESGMKPATTRELTEIYRMDGAVKALVKKNSKFDCVDKRYFEEGDLNETKMVMVFGQFKTSYNGEDYLFFPFRISYFDRRSKSYLIDLVKSLNFDFGGGRRWWSEDNVEDSICTYHENGGVADSRFCARQGQDGKTYIRWDWINFGKIESTGYFRLLEKVL